jgi:DNA-binding MarR family transcriptional regulator
MATNTPTATTDPAWWDAWRGVLFASSHSLRELESMLEEHSGISLNFMDVLSRLHDAPEQRLRMQELQERALFTRSGMTRLVDRIEEAGLARRERVPGDRRGVFVVLTPAGAEVYESAIEKHRQDVGQVFGRALTQQQCEAVAAALWSFWHEDEDGSEGEGSTRRPPTGRA